MRFLGGKRNKNGVTQSLQSNSSLNANFINSHNAGIGIIEGHSVGVKMTRGKEKSINYPQQRPLFPSATNPNSYQQHGVGINVVDEGEENQLGIGMIVGVGAGGKLSGRRSGGNDENYLISGRPSKARGHFGAAIHPLLANDFQQNNSNDAVPPNATSVLGKLRSRVSVSEREKEKNTANINVLDRDREIPVSIYSKGAAGVEVCEGSNKGQVIKKNSNRYNNVSR
jgi:hypothetical protein